MLKLHNVTIMMIIIFKQSKTIAFQCPHSFETITELGMSGKNVTWEEPANLTVSDSLYLHVKGSHSPGTEFPVGVTWVNYTMVDSKNHRIACNFSVTVLAGKE